MKTLVIKGIISATSDKQSDKFKVETLQKSVHIVVDELFEAQLIAFGLTKYTPQEKGAQPYFVVKAAKKIRYNNDEYISGLADGNQPNFHSDGKLVAMNLIKSTSEQGNEFVRLNAILGKVQEFESIDPFADIDLDLSDIEMPDELDARGITEPK